VTSDQFSGEFLYRADYMSATRRASRHGCLPRTNVTACVSAAPH